MTPYLKGDTILKTIIIYIYVRFREGNPKCFLDVVFVEVITVVLVLYFAIRAAIHASEWLCAPSATRKARRLMLRAATAKEYKALGGLG